MHRRTALVCRIELESLRETAVNSSAVYASSMKMSVTTDESLLPVHAKVRRNNRRKNQALLRNQIAFANEISRNFWDKQSSYLLD